MYKIHIDIIVYNLTSGCFCILTYKTCRFSYKHIKNNREHWPNNNNINNQEQTSYCRVTKSKGFL